MARLNEPPIAPATTLSTGPGGIESIDALKRRFIRQNRDLAKANSSQSLRIRSLELENGRLLAVNFDLRSQNLELQNEQRKASLAAVARVKMEMEKKMAEIVRHAFDTLLQEEPVDKAAILDSNNRHYRDRQPLSELMRDSQMPPIAEGKTYPRQTLNADEARAMRLSDHSSAGSPDLGPPPIAHFDDREPIKLTQSLDVPERPSIVSKPSEEDPLPESVSVNLDTRRKRKDGQSRLEIRRHSILAQSPVKGDEEVPTTILRTGAKRKLADRETEKPIRPPNSTDFSFTRITKATSAVESELPASTTIEKSVHEKAVHIKDLHLESPPRPARKVLGEKSVNLSPLKTGLAHNKPLKDTSRRPPAIRLSAPKGATATRDRRLSAIYMSRANDQAIVEISPESLVPDQLPRTPTEPDPFSPMSSEPSARLVEKRDTPPPVDLSAISNTTDGGQRPSRRARSAVNYAEPSLIAKMRRPDIQMVDAISGLQDPRRVMNGSKEKQASEVKTVIIKREPGEEDDFPRSELSSIAGIQPGSPLSEKCSSGLLAPADSGVTAATANRRCRTSAPFSKDKSSTILDKTAPLVKIERGMEELDLYDFKDSSSPTIKDSASCTIAEEASTARTHRRHSSMPREVQTLDVLRTKKGEVTTAGGSGSRVASRRRSMML